MEPKEKTQQEPLHITGKTALNSIMILPHLSTLTAEKTASVHPK